MPRRSDNCCTRGNYGLATVILIFSGAVSVVAGFVLQIKSEWGTTSQERAQNNQNQSDLVPGLIIGGVLAVSVGCIVRCCKEPHVVAYLPCYAARRAALSGEGEPPFTPASPGGP